MCKFEPPFFLKEIGSVLYLHASLVLNFLVSLLKKILNTKILLASMKTLPNSETCAENRIASEFLSGLLSLSLVGFPPRDHLSLDGAKVGLNIHVMGGLQNNFQNHSQVPEQVLQ